MSGEPTPWRPASTLPTEADAVRRTRARDAMRTALMGVVDRAAGYQDTQRRLASVAALRDLRGELDRAVNAALWNAIEVRRAQGAGWVDIARELDITITQLQRIRARHEEERGS